MTTPAEVAVKASIALTVLGGLAGYRVLLRTGLFTDGTVEREVPLFDATGEYYAFRSRWHRLAAWLVGFLGGWGATLLAYVYVLDVTYFAAGT